MRARLLSICALLLVGCGAVRPVSTVATYDLGTLQPAADAVAGLRSVDVFAVSWLDTPAMQYRLLYAEDRRRQSYAESRWVAPPPQLVGHALRKRLLSGEAGGGCRLRVDLDEFVQLFDSAKSSRVLLEARAQLFAPGTEGELARRSFSLSQPAAAADAASGVTAMAATVEAFSAALRDWLGGLDRFGAAGLNIAQRCRR
jgi:cholesterol transport system auxiliary component